MSDGADQGVVPSEPMPGEPAILVVDDNIANRLAFEAILAPLGHRIIKAASGQEALRYLLQTPVLLILLDVQMPEMSGLELATLLKSHPRLSTVPIIFVTALDREASQVFAGYAHGAVDYLMKPFDPELLRVKVNVFLELHRRQEKIREQAVRLHEHELLEVKRRNQERLRGLVDSMPLPMWWVRPDGTTYGCNAAWTEYSGRTNADADSFADPQWMHPDDVERAGSLWRRHSAHKRPFDIETRLLRASDQEIRWHLLRVLPERGDRALDGFWTVVGIDIDAQKRVDEIREQLLVQEQAARREAEAGSRMKDEFLATVSHELRTPLNAILGWTRILRTGAMESDRAGHALATIERNAQAQVKLVNDILDVARIINGKLRLQIESVDLVAVLGDAVDTLRPTAEARGVELAWRAPDREVHMNGDAARLLQIAWNLVSNAVKFTPKGGRVAVSLECGGERVRVLVADSGLGIPPDFLPYVFERFRQGEAGKNRVHEGLGLGLAIVKHLVELHGGEVRAASEGLGRGAVFTVELPVGATAAERGSSEAPLFVAQSGTLPASGIVLARLDGVSVLLVEDRADAAAMLQELFVKCGAEVRWAPDVTQALEAFRERTPDVLVSDIGLPGEDGYALIRRVRALSGRAAQVPAIALSGFARPEDEGRAKQEGFHVHLAKPVEPDELASLIASLLASQSERSGSNQNAA
jgi:signal transduction histidine kinase/DNA-binding response OmpR family regulator